MFSSQFSLSLELTRLLPFAATDLLSLARQLRQSGSDLITEEDVSQIFGRNKLATHFEATFKEVVGRSSQQTILNKSLAIVIEGGAGPTMQRAMKERAYFSTVVQLSMLMWAHEDQAFAEVLSEAMRRRLQGAPPDVQSSPGERALLGVLKACQEQTSTFPWQLTFDAVRAKMGLLPPIANNEPGSEDLALSLPILQGCLDMLTAIQSWPEDMLYIQCRTGVVTLVVWAHCLLGLTVCVKSSRVGTVSFGTGMATVIIELIGSGDQSQACLLDSSHELVLAVQGDGAETVIDAEVKYAAKGYGTVILRREISNDGAVFEMAQVTAAIAWCISQKLEVVPSNRKDGKTGKDGLALESSYPKRHNCLSSDERNLSKATLFLFDGIDLDQNLVTAYIPEFTRQPLDYNLPIPPAVNVVLDQRKERVLVTDPDGNTEKSQSLKWIHWNNLLRRARELALLILALSTINDLNKCQQWPLGGLDCIRSSIMAEKLEDWNGRQSITLHHDGWYDLLGHMMLGRKYAGPGDSCVISNWGWSMWMSTFTDVDPLGVVPGELTVMHGVPSRNGERRTRVVDGPCNVSYTGPLWRHYERCGDMTTPRCEMTSELKPNLIGARGDEFIVSVRFVSDDAVMNVGYRTMHKRLWDALLIGECDHKPDTSTILSLGVATGTGIDWTVSTLPRICVPLVRGNRHSRWMAVLGRTDDNRGVALAGQRICLQCAIDRTCRLNGNWVLVC